MLKILFLILVGMVTLAFAQEGGKPDSSEKPQAKLFTEFAKVHNGQIRTYLDSFFWTLQNNPTAKGLIFNYGTKRDIVIRERLYRNHIDFRNVDASQFKFDKGKRGSELKTQFWIVPAGAEPPKP